MSQIRLPQSVHLNRTILLGHVWYVIRMGMRKGKEMRMEMEMEMEEMFV